MLVRLADVDGYNKLIDFDNLQVEEGLYVDTGYLDVYPLEESDEAVVKDGRWRQIVLTRDGSERVKGYVDGDREVTVDDPTKSQVLGADEFLHFLKDDESTGDEESAGMIARLRIYSDALSDKKIRNLGK